MERRLREMIYGAVGLLLVHFRILIWVHGFSNQVEAVEVVEDGELDEVRFRVAGSG